MTKYERFIRAVQEELKAHGHYHGRIDGDPGPLTWRGWDAYQLTPRKRPAGVLPDKFPEPPLCSVQHDGVYPMAEDVAEGESHYRTTDGFLWTRDGKKDPKTGRQRLYHPAQDITRRMPGEPVGLNSDGIFGAPKGSRILSCLPGVVVAINKGGTVWSITVRHLTKEFGLCYSNYRHIDGEAPGIVEGMLVEAGTFIAWNGTTGTTLRHLHFQFCVASKSKRDWRKNDYGWLQMTAINLGGRDWDHHRDGWLNAWPRRFIAL